MSQFSADIPLVIIGAGAAGLGASEQAKGLGVDHLILEAAHRTGGRGLTEMLNDQFPVDLGCHWMHCGSQNLLAKKARAMGEPYETNHVPYRDFNNGNWEDEAYSKRRWDYIESVYEDVERISNTDRGAPVLDSFDIEDSFSPWASYWLSLMHSNDPDQVAVSDLVDFKDTYEDWPVQNGYGALIAKCGEPAPVSLNTAVQKINYHGPKIEIETNKGTLRADKVIITVSTGVLAAQDIMFSPELPDNLLQAITDLPLGNYNYLFYALEEGAISDETISIAYERDEVATSVRLREFGRPTISIPVGGRFAWWLESQSEVAIRNWGLEVIKDLFGNKAEGYVTGFKRSAWGYDQWIKGAYSSQRPGSVGSRKIMMEPVNNCLWFAGEAVSEHVFNTAHGAWESGQRAVMASVA